MGNPQRLRSDTQLEATGKELGHPVEDIRLITTDGVGLHGWYYPARAQSARRHMAILILHGNAGNISHRLPLYRAWLDEGLNVLAIDYRGYGRSEGKPTEEGTYLDAEAAWEWLAKNGFSPEHTLVYGESLGGAVATELALRRRIGGLILQSTFTSIPDIGCEIYPYLPIRWLSSIKYDSRAKLGRINVPVMILHGRRDSLVGFHHAERNFEAAKEPKCLVEIPGDHTSAFAAGPEEFAAAVAGFLTRLENMP